MPTFQTLMGVDYHAPSVIVDVQNELVEPSALEKSIAVFGDFPELKPGAVYTSIQGGAQIDEAYSNIPSIRNYSQIWRRSLLNIDGQAQRLSFINCGTSTQAEFNIATAADGAVQGATFKSRYYGTKGNLLRVRLETPDTPTGDPAGIGLSATDKYYRVVASGSGQERASFEFGNADILAITYTDTDAGDVDGTITIADGTIRIQTGTVDETLQLDDFSSLDELKEAIEAQSSKFVVSINNYDVSSAAVLDEGVYVFNDDGAPNTPVEVKIHAHVAALKEGIDRLGAAVPYVIELSDDRYRHLAPTAGDADAAPLQFEARDTAATQSSATVSDYRTVLTTGEMLAKDFTSVCILDTNSSVHKLGKTYLEVSYQNQKERNGFFPAPSNQSLEALFNLYVKEMSSERISIVGQDVSFEDYQGNRYSGDTKDLAFVAMAAHGALPAGAAASQKSLRILGTEENWNRELDIHQLAKRNIWGVFLNDNNELAVVRSLTSYVRDNLPQNNEVSVRESIDTSSRDIRKFLSAELGSTIKADTVGRVRNLTSQRLSLHRDRGIIRAFANVQVSIVDDTAFISYDLQPTQAINFIRITARITRDIE